jgi:hypothetical protein
MHVSTGAARSIASADAGFAAMQIAEALEFLKAINENAQVAINKVKLRSAKSSLTQATNASASPSSKVTYVKSARQALDGFKLEQAAEDVVELVGEAMVKLDQVIPELESQERLEAIKKEEREIESRRKSAETRRVLGGLLNGALGIYIGSENDKERQKWMSENPLQSESDIVCESHQRSSNTAPMDCGTSLYIEEISIMELYSKADCVYGKTYGFSGRNIIVQNGCRAKFKVWGRANPPPASYRNAAADRMKEVLGQ